MSTFVTTLVIAVLVTMLALFGLGIGWILTGKSRIRRGACGMDPTKPRDGSCGKKIQCGLCDRNIEPDPSEETETESDK